MARRTLIVLPDDTGKSILEAIHTAKKSIRIKMFVFNDPGLINAVITAKGRGVEVKVMLNPGRRSGELNNAGTFKLLSAAGIDVKDSNSAFGLTHEKSMVIDEKIAFVNSLNFETENLTTTRDYAIITDHRSEVMEVMSCFDADWNRSVFDSGENAKLIWCTGNGRERIATFIDHARHSLFVQNERFQDSIIIERLVRASIRGVKVHVMARSPHTLSRDKLIEGVGGLRIMDDVGIKVHKLKHLKLHGKMLIADGSRAIVGSINLAPGSFDKRRELAIEINDEEIVDRLHKIAKHDWKNSHAIDLTDEGLLRDLQDRIENSKEILALKGKGKK
ncbi:phospholipase D-like domain-containing protein [Pollutibacter soli]|uniref:phospholipase D-like domain-containing protein n=1 Tax=Pollutibacter soli TaxID=3034157 RepID=UPI003013FC7A